MEEKTPDYFQLDNDKYTEFKPHVVNVGNIQFKGNPDSLSRFPQWVWYTIAPPALWGGLDNKVLAALQQETGVSYHKKVFDKPIFDGFDTPGEGAIWNHVLWAVPQPEWWLLKSEFLGITNVDTDSQLIVKYGLQELIIYDPLSVDRGAIASENTTMKIYAFGVMSNKKTIAFDPAQKLTERPRVYTFKPEDDIITLATDVLSGGVKVRNVVERMADRRNGLGSQRE